MGRANEFRSLSWKNSSGKFIILRFWFWDRIHYFQILIFRVNSLFSNFELEGRFYNFFRFFGRFWATWNGFQGLVCHVYEENFTILPHTGEFLGYINITNIHYPEIMKIYFNSLWVIRYFENSEEFGAYSKFDTFRFWFFTQIHYFAILKIGRMNSLWRFISAPP